ncbi:MAG TPA: Gfo/Idh/MocA family oxidoreductase [Bryobacteraceae bacterium]|nr:Gfo/Idh/MocA family oxidoreductase [Bryobacteraceae bacterium]
MIDSSTGKQGPSRRELAATGLGALIVPRHVLGGSRHQAPSDTLRIAAVGVGGMGRRYIAGCAEERIVLLCDVDQSFAAPVLRKYASARVYTDWRQMFDKEEKNFDALIVATPDHNHAVITSRALKMGKHVYCAKPLTHDLNEARRIRTLAQEAKVATQMSVQSCASDEALGTAEILMSGIIGPVREVHIWTHHPIYPAGQVRPKETPDVPYGLDWDIWIGPAPERSYHPKYHPWIWRCWWDFGSATVGDMLCHGMHVYYKALELGSPSSIYAYGTTMYGGYFHMLPDGQEDLPRVIRTPESESYSNVIMWDFPERNGRPALRMIWYDGGMRPPRPVELDPKTPMPKEGLLFIGEKGKLLSGYYGGKNLLLPESEFRDYEPPPKILHRTIGHYKEWLEGCKHSTPTNCNFDIGSRMTEIALLGKMAARAARPLEFDANGPAIPNDPEANSWINPQYRHGWQLS